MDDVPDERYTSADVMRATEPVVAPVAPETPIPPREYEERRVVADRVDRPGFSFGDSFLGWNVAAFWMLVLTGLVLALLGNAAYNQSGAGANAAAIDLNGLAMAGIAGLLIAQFVAYFIGGFAAGRMARGSGVANGLGVAVWGVVIALLVGALVYWAGTAYNLGYWATFYGVNFGNWTGQVVGILVGTLIAMFLGAVLGGMLGARPWDARYRAYEERRGVVRRGRPL